MLAEAQLFLDECYQLYQCLQAVEAIQTAGTQPQC